MSYAVADLNGDNRTDLMIFCQDSTMINVLIADSNGLFEEVILIPINIFYILLICVGDLNGDGLVDLIVGHINFDERGVIILYGNGDGTFETEGNDTLPIRSYPNDIAVIDLNDDNKLDVIVASAHSTNIYIYYGNGNKTFSQSTLFIGRICNPMRLTIADFNNDSYLDIAVFNDQSLHIYVFFKNADGNFQSPKLLYTAYFTYTVHLGSGIFHNEYQSNMIFLYSEQETVSRLYRYSNGSFHVNEQIVVDSFIPLNFDSVLVHDLNGDKYSDIVLSAYTSYAFYILLGSENGNFQIQYISLSDINDLDFNNNTCHDAVRVHFGMGNLLYILFNTCDCSTP